MSVTCPNCQSVNRDGARFCDNCGQALPAACPVCGTFNRASARFCDNCGTRLGAPEANLPAAPSPAAPLPAVEPLARPAAPSSVPTSLHQYIPAELLAKIQAAQASGGMVGE